MLKQKANEHEKKLVNEKKNDQFKMIKGIVSADGRSKIKIDFSKDEKREEP